MSYEVRSKIVYGTMSNGESSTLIAMAAEVDRENLESYVLVTFVHETDYVHSLTITSSHMKTPIAVNALLRLASKNLEKWETSEEIPPMGMVRAFFHRRNKLDRLWRYIRRARSTVGSKHVGNRHTGIHGNG